MALRKGRGVVSPARGHPSRRPPPALWMGSWLRFAPRWPVAAAGRQLHSSGAAARSPTVPWPKLALGGGRKGDSRRLPGPRLCSPASSPREPQGRRGARNGVTRTLDPGARGTCSLIPGDLRRRDLGRGAATVEDLPHKAGGTGAPPGVPTRGLPEADQGDPPKPGALGAPPPVVWPVSSAHNLKGKAKRGFWFFPCEKTGSHTPLGGLLSCAWSGTREGKTQRRPPLVLLLCCFGFHVWGLSHIPGFFFFF